MGPTRKTFAFSLLISFSLVFLLPPASLAQNSLPTEKQFTGHVFDQSSNLYYMRARYYDPVIGRFLSPDAQGDPVAGGNRYSYVGNNPVILVDPSGNQGNNCRLGDFTCSMERYYIYQNAQGQALADVWRRDIYGMRMGVNEADLGMVAVSAADIITFGAIESGAQNACMVKDDPTNVTAWAGLAFDSLTISMTITPGIYRGVQAGKVRVGRYIFRGVAPEALTMPAEMATEADLGAINRRIHSQLGQGVVIEERLTAGQIASLLSDKEFLRIAKQTQQQRGVGRMPTVITPEIGPSGRLRARIVHHGGVVEFSDIAYPAVKPSKLSRLVRGEEAYVVRGGFPEVLKTALSWAAEKPTVIIAGHPGYPSRFQWILLKLAELAD